MRKLFLTATFAIFSIWLFCQNENPFSQFGYEAPIMHVNQTNNLNSTLIIINTDSNLNIGWISINPRKKVIEIFDKSGKLCESDTILNYSITRWLSIDPKNQYNSPYLGMGNNPINGVDPDGAFWEEMGNWISNGYWVSDTGMDAIRNGGSYNGWTGNRFSGYATIGTTVNGESTITAYDAIHDFTPHFSIKLTIGVQAGSSLGSLGSKYGVFGNLYSVTLLGYESETNHWYYPTSEYGKTTQMNQSLSGGVFLGGEIYHTFNGRFDESGYSNGDNWDASVSLGPAKVPVEIEVSKSLNNGNKPLITPKAEFKGGLVLGVETKIYW